MEGGHGRQGLHSTPGSLAENVDERVGPVGTGELWGASGGWQLLPAQSCPFLSPFTQISVTGLSGP